jgi:hypothetical protein
MGAPCRRRCLVRPHVGDGTIVYARELNEIRDDRDRWRDLALVHAPDVLAVAGAIAMVRTGAVPVAIRLVPAGAAAVDGGNQVNRSTCLSDRLLDVTAAAGSRWESGQRKVPAFL